MDIAILSAAAAVAAIVFHRVMHDYWLAAVVAAGVGSGVYQIIVYLELGYLDPFFLIAFAVGGAIGFPIALAVGTIPGVRARRAASRNSG